MSDKLGPRLFLAKNHLERQRGRAVSYAELGRLVAQHEGRKLNGKLQPYTSGNVNRWVHDMKEPGREAIGAFADVCGVRRGWLAFNEGPMLEGGEVDATTPAVPIHRAPPKLSSGLRAAVTAKAPARKRRSS